MAGPARGPLMSLGSRAQLAAALVEYDNDELHPSQRRNHRQSALFSGPIQRSPPAPQLSPPRTRYDDRPGPSSRNEYSGQPIQERHHGRQPSDHRTDAAATHEDDNEDEIDVSRWDLPSHLIAAAPIATQRVPFPSTRPGTALSHITTKSVSTPVPVPEFSPVQGRAVSIHLDRDQSFPSQQPGEASRSRHEGEDSRRRTISFDLAHPRRRTQSSSVHLQGADAALAAAERAFQLAEGISALPPRSKSVMGLTDGFDPYLRGQRVSEPIMIPLPGSPLSAIASGRPMSRETRWSMDLDRTKSPLEAFMEDDDLDQGEYLEGDVTPGEGIGPNPFALPAPPASQASRFDPKYARSEISVSSGLPGQPISPGSTLRDLPGRPESVYSLRPATTSAHRMSTLSIRPSPQFEQDPIVEQGQAPRPTFAEIPTPETYGRPLQAPKYARRAPVDRHSLMRPRQLIMPSSLSSAELAQEACSAAQRQKAGRAGFTLGDVPLPKEARSSILSMGAARKLDGRQFGAGLAGELRVQQEEQEMAERRLEEERMERDKRSERMPGKLYGTSLMDQLEARKQYTKNKSRVFTGDSRPSMFARQSQAGLSQLASSPDGPAEPRPDSYLGQSTSPDKRHSLRPPLIQFDPNDADAPGDADEQRPRMSKSKSVFGVDQLWEKEMSKLKIIQAEEEARRMRQEEQEREAAERERAKEAKGKKGWLGKSKDKGKGKAKDTGLVPNARSPDRTGYGGYEGFEPGSGSTEKEYAQLLAPEDISPIRKSADLPPTLSYSPEKRHMAVPAMEAVPADIGRRAASRAGLDGWSSDDEDEGYVRVRKDKQQHQQVQEAEHDRSKRYQADEESSEDDVPLSRIIPRHPIMPPRPADLESDSDSDEDIPLSKLAPPKPAPAAPQIQLNSDLAGSLGLDLPALPPAISPRPTTVPPAPSALPTLAIVDGDDNDDDKPLGLRPGKRVSVPPGRTEEERAEIEDDLPLAFKHGGAAQRQVSASASTPYGVPGLQSAMYGAPAHMGMGMNAYPSMTFAPSPYGMPMPMPQTMHSTSMYGLAGYGQPAYPGYGGMGGMSAYPQQQYQQGMMPPAGYFAQPSMPVLPTAGGASGHDQGMMDFGGGGGPGPGPGHNIDSWRKGVRAPSTVGGESGR